ncbi:CoA ester lyase [Mesorhizobium sp. KR9-304]|uniref:HpcH/HpaI aldolase/citrate lyase family protein n=1 Tax=Mesorhizobium sp. KR9-304 TaxID=3156614 RepID=UPI0032B4E66A
MTPASQGRMHGLAAVVAPLFVPASRPDRFAKAATSGADAIIVDLEDAVPANLKDEARANLGTIFGLAVPAFVRINAEGTPWHEAYLDALSALGIRRICVPKVEDADVLGRIAQIETAAGLEGAQAIARHPQVSQLAFGPADFFLDMGMLASAEMTRHVLCRLAIASRAAGIAAPLDGPAFTMGDAAVLATECLTAVACGAGGKLCIHPAQPGAVLEHFLPGASEVEWARRIVSEGGDDGARVVQGQMIDAPLIARAQLVLQRSRGRGTQMARHNQEIRT